MAITLVGWHCLLCLGELVNHDSTSLCDFCKSINHLSVKFVNLPHPHVSFFLPMHKADRLFKGSTVIFKKHSSSLDPVHFFKVYLNSHDSLPAPSSALAPQQWVHPHMFMVHELHLHCISLKRHHQALPSVWWCHCACARRHSSEPNPKHRMLVLRCIPYLSSQKPHPYPGLTSWLVGF